MSNGAPTAPNSPQPPAAQLPPSRSSSPDVAARTATFQNLVLECADGKFTLVELLDRLRNAGANASEAEDYVIQARKALEALTSAPQRQPQQPARQSTPDGLSDEDREAFRKSRDDDEARARRKAVEDAGWALLRAKVTSLGDPQPSFPLLDIAALLDLHNQPSAPRSIPPSIFAAAPHLAALSASHPDSHIQQTLTLKRELSIDKAIEPLIDRLACQPLREALPRSIWKDIILDRYVLFSKLHAGLQSNYDHRDEYKELTGEFVIVRKDQVNVRRAVTTEAEWIRVFGAWEAGVVMVYPHREGELARYRNQVLDIFHSAPHLPHKALNFDEDVRTRYSKIPFRLDDRNEQSPSLLAVLFGNPTSSGSSKRSAALQSTSKRFAPICQNWNLGICADPCPGERKHGLCSECNERHRARDHKSCFESLTNRRKFFTRQGASQNYGGGSFGGSAAVHNA